MFRIAMPRAKKHPKLSNEGLSIGVPSEQSDRWGRPRAHGSLHHAQIAASSHGAGRPRDDLPASAATGNPSVLPYLPPKQRSTLRGSEDVTVVTGCSSSTPLFFGPLRRSETWRAGNLTLGLLCAAGASSVSRACPKNSD